ncbi:Methionine aminopeptidase [Fulvivirga imtechensis AK7]|uniref:Methionine aminopeptidase n=1 Tax=Fulvivirga imtechensis AK7 TaxID=1237149 RepID=L8JL03_9BACT|nr:type I methionyl aminopeptidase [Fulvivirga imtechensis]ELR69480.1 Methionine aminopeptidase [Fulvivirga imtechensis AK7]
MSITSELELIGMKKSGEVVGETLRRMREFARPGMTTKQLDDFGGKILKAFGARSAPRLTYNFPGWTCISVNNEIAHGIPSNNKILQEGDLVNIDVSAEFNGFWADNGGSFVLGEDISNHQPLVDASKQILHRAIDNIRGGVLISEIGRLIETGAKKAGYKVIRNLTGHGIGRSLHEDPAEITNYYDKFNKSRFRKNSVVAIETFISTRSTFADTKNDGWTLIGNRGGYVAQHEHTIVVTDDRPIVLTASNNIW